MASCQSTPGQVSGHMTDSNIKDTGTSCQVASLGQWLLGWAQAPPPVQVRSDPCVCVCVSGLQVDGIYRVSGNLATIQKLRLLVDQGGWSCRRPPPRTSADVSLLSPEEQLDLDHSQWEDIHVVTGALKMFFRELPEPLVPFRTFPLLLEAISEWAGPRDQRLLRLNRDQRLLPLTKDQRLLPLNEIKDCCL